MSIFQKFVLIALVLLGCFFLTKSKNSPLTNAPQWDQLTFDYSPGQLGYLKEMPKPDSRITSESLSQLTNEVSHLIHSTKLSEIDETIFPAYLANAQKDFGVLTYLLTGKLTGDLGPITLWTLQLFIPEAILPSIQESDFDVYTSSLSSIIINKVAKRLNAERRQIASYSIKKGDSLWHPTSPGYIGLSFGSIKTWFLTSSKDYWADFPSSSVIFWAAQCAKIKNEQAHLNDQKIQATFAWATSTNEKWTNILNNYLEEKNVPVMSQLQIRALFQSSLVDANAVCFNSKYTYWIMRPSQFSDGIKLLIEIPNHPSYPSAHSTISSTAATVLSELFPEEKEKWDRIAEEAGMSRIWGGIHYPADHKAGLKLGKQVGQKILKKASKNR